MKKRIIISIIVPIFYGKKYIQNIIHQVETCTETLPDKYDIELIFINDAPDDKIDITYFSEKVKIFIKNTEKNRGIHGARVFGLECSEGQFILFLDQDDKIMPGYFASQIQLIKNADAIVCRCIHENKQYYNMDFPFEKVISKEHMMTNGCSIISPGQVLLRKSSIPNVWINNIMQTNCADDFFLWLCMMAENKQFTLNQEVLFQHVVNGVNYSLDTNRMIASEQEMLKILVDKQIYSGEELEKIKTMIQMTLLKKIDSLVKFKKMFFILNQWSIYREKRYSFVDYLSEHKISKIAIYGYGYLGKRLKGELENSSITVNFFIDKNAFFINEIIPVYTLEQSPYEIDAIIVSLVYENEEVLKRLKDKYGSKIYTINEIQMQIESRLEI